MSHLVGRSLPSVSLPSTTGDAVDLSRLAGNLVVFLYPYTGRPGVPDPEGWDDIPGAHGSTPQCLAYSELYAEYRTLNVKLFGVSQLSHTWQTEFARRSSLQVPLLSDESRRLTDALALEVFPAGARTFLKRQTLIVRDRVIINAHQPVDPARDAHETLKLFRKP